MATLPNFAHIRIVRDRQVLITREHEIDEDGESTVHQVVITFDCHAGCRANLNIGYFEIEDAEGAFEDIQKGLKDDVIAQNIDDQETAWAGKLVPA